MLPMSETRGCSEVFRLSSKDSTGPAELMSRLLYLTTWIILSVIPYNSQSIVSNRVESDVRGVSP